MTGWMVGLACAVVVALVVPQAQQPPPQRPPFAEHVDVSSIVVDARVIDEFGAPVLGLSASDFFVTIGGKPVKVQSSLWTGNVAMPAVPQHSASPDHETAIAAEPGQLVILLFQKSLVHDRARGLIRMVEQSRSLVRELPESARVAILLFEDSLRVWSDFTTDRAALDRILAHGLLHERPPASVPRGNPSLVDGLTVAPRRIQTIEGVFAAIATVLEPLPGSKAVAFIGYGMGKVSLGSRQDLDQRRAAFGSQDVASGGAANREYEKARRTLTAARVAVFSLDITNADTHTLAQGMQTIAADTGGFYASSVDFPERPMRLVGGALNGHYVLFVEPPAEPTDRSIIVRVSGSRRASVFSTSSYR